MQTETDLLGEVFMNTDLMRLAWSVVDETPLPRQQTLSLSERIGALIHEVEKRVVLSPQERQQIQQYLIERQHLITDLYR
ncbi:MAG: hypothetical protein AAFV46_02130 [Cyanobacteria bacterium J06635_11]